MKKQNKKLFIIILILIIILIVFVVLVVLNIKKNLKYKKQVENLFIKEKIEISIPKQIHQTWKTKNPNDIFHKKIINKHKRDNPEWEFLLYDDNDIDVFIKTHFNNRIYNAFKRINPVFGPAVADFFRYCILYIKGGIYLDMKSVIKQPLNKLLYYPKLKEKDVLLVGHWPNKNVWKQLLPDPNGEIMNWVIISTPKHLILYDIILQITSNIENYTYDIKPKHILEYEPNTTSVKFSVLETTGPIMFSKVLWKYKNNSYLDVNDILINYMFQYNGFKDHIKIYKQLNIIHYNRDSDDTLIL